MLTCCVELLVFLIWVCYWFSVWFGLLLCFGGCGLCLLRVYCLCVVGCVDLIELNISTALFCKLCNFLLI